MDYSKKVSELFENITGFKLTPGMRMDEALMYIGNLIEDMIPFKPGEYVHVYGKISQPETFLGKDYRKYNGEVMQIVALYNGLVELKWTGHRRTCHVPVRQLKLVNK